MSKKSVWISLGLTLMAASAAWAQKKEDMILAELRQIQAQLSELQTSQAALKTVVDSLNAGAAEQQDSLRKNLADSKIAMERCNRTCPFSRSVSTRRTRAWAVSGRTW